MPGASQTLTLEEFAAWAEARGVSLTNLDLTPAFKRVAVSLIASTKENFTGGHAPDGATWPPLKRPRRNSKGRDKPLRDTGLLMASVSARGQGHVETVTPMSMLYGTNLDYAGYHQGGTRTIPARPFLGFNADMADKVALIIADYLDEVLSK